MSNRLASESSPYLKQHADNPVDWSPWGPEARARATDEDRPILLSIGYSACHWCHVMERECFEDPAIARSMSERFVCVKVDREERPDLDHLYQLVVQRMGRSGGWPLTVFLTPALRPFFGGTYFPPTPRHGMASFPAVLDAVHEAWTARRADVEEMARELTADLARLTAAPTGDADIPIDLARRSAATLAPRIDDRNGGFGDRPKFPNTMALELMLRAAHDGEPGALDHVERALDAMRAGGLWDQLGFGFHRYSTDAAWTVPHFEKMLYDNALLARLAAELHRATGAARHAETARGILAWAEREMTDPQGAFYATMDADSEGEEGRFFVWTPEAIDACLSPQDAELAKLLYGVTATGNFEGTGATVLTRRISVDAAASQLGLPPARVEGRLEPIRRALLLARGRRPRPFRDEKVLTTWNGLFIGACAEVGAALGDAHALSMAQRALSAVRSRLVTSEGVWRVWKDGEAKIPAFLEDHADLAGAALDVFEACDDAEARSLAQALVEGALARFWDETEGAFSIAPRDAPDLLAVPRDTGDAAVPGGASSMCHALLRLAAHLDGSEAAARYTRIAERVLRAHVQSAMKHPLGYGHLLGAMDRLARGPTFITVVGDKDCPATSALLDVARRAWVPNRVLTRIDPGTALEGTRLGTPQPDGPSPAAYVCRDRTCFPKASDTAGLRALLAAPRP